MSPSRDIEKVVDALSQLYADVEAGRLDDAGH
jgi:hypothetical protein